MMQKTSELTGFVQPSAAERASVARYFRAYYESHIRFRKRAASALCVGGVALLAFTAQTGIASLVLGILCFAAGFFCIKGKNDLKHRILDFEQGRFAVLHGRAARIQMNPDTPGCRNVQFVSNDGQMFDAWFRARQEGLEVGTPLLLVYKKSASAKDEITWVFTDFMLTDEGIRLHW